MAAPFDPYQQARIDLQTSIGSQVIAGDAAWSAGNYSAAVTAYQSAGQQGAAVIGPEIDAAGYPAVTQKYTQQAWQLNGTLAAVNPTTAQQPDALVAQTLAYKIQQLYTAAMNAGMKAANP